MAWNQTSFARYNPPDSSHAHLRAWRPLRLASMPHLAPPLSGPLVALCALLAGLGISLASLAVPSVRQSLAEFLRSLLPPAPSPRNAALPSASPSANLTNERPLHDSAGLASSAEPFLRLPDDVVVHVIDSIAHESSMVNSFLADLRGADPVRLIAVTIFLCLYLSVRLSGWTPNGSPRAPVERSGCRCFNSPRVARACSFASI